MAACLSGFRKCSIPLYGIQWRNIVCMHSISIHESSRNWEGVVNSFFLLLLCVSLSLMSHLSSVGCRLSLSLPFVSRLSPISPYPGIVGSREIARIYCALIRFTTTTLQQTTWFTWICYLAARTKYSHNFSSKRCLKNLYLSIHIATNQQIFMMPDTLTLMLLTYEKLPEHQTQTHSTHWKFEKICLPVDDCGIIRMHDHCFRVTIEKSMYSTHYNTHTWL